MPTKAIKDRPPFPLRNAVPPLLFERSRPGRPGVAVPRGNVPEREPADLLPRELLARSRRRCPRWPSARSCGTTSSCRLRNMSIDANFYPLGSCTMKYNPKVNEWARARCPASRACTRCAGRAARRARSSVLCELQQTLARDRGHGRGHAPAGGRRAGRAAAAAHDARLPRDAGPPAQEGPDPRRARTARTRRLPRWPGSRS